MPALSATSRLDRATAAGLSPRTAGRECPGRAARSSRGGSRLPVTRRGAPRTRGWTGSGGQGRRFPAFAGVVLRPAGRSRGSVRPRPWTAPVPAGLHRPASPSSFSRSRSRTALRSIRQRLHRLGERPAGGLAHRRPRRQNQAERQNGDNGKACLRPPPALTAPPRGAKIALTGTRPHEACPVEHGQGAAQRDLDGGAMIRLLTPPPPPPPLLLASREARRPHSPSPRRPCRGTHRPCWNPHHRKRLPVGGRSDRSPRNARHAGPAPARRALPFA